MLRQGARARAFQLLGPYAPSIRQSLTISRTGDGGSTNFIFGSNVLVGSSVLVLLGETGSGFTVSNLGTWSTTSSMASSLNSHIAWCSSVTSGVDYFTLTYNSGFHNVAGVAYEITGQVGKAVLSSFTETSQITVNSGTTFSAGR